MSMTNLAALRIRNPHTWDKNELYTNLQAAVDVELWTIPLYLTALYSMQNLNSKDQQNYPVAAKLIESVVIEEMLHLQLISNICNALGYSPRMEFPTYNEGEGIPFIKANVPPKYRGYEVKLGGLDVNQLKLFCVIELPEPKSKPDWATQTRYNSIGELYQALEIAITHLWDQLYVGEANNTRQQANFTDFSNKLNLGIGFSQMVNSLPAALAAMGAIVEQGEGNHQEEVPVYDQPTPDQPYGPKNDDPSDFDPTASHFKKFDQVLDLLLHGGKSLPLTYPLIPQPNENELAKQKAAIHILQVNFSKFLGELATGFNTPQPKNQMPQEFWNNMFAMQTAITNVWATGAVPVFPKQAVTDPAVTAPAAATTAASV